MAYCTSSSSPSSASENPMLSAVRPSFSGASDDAFEDACSICLEPFSSDDPATITTCKHEYHIHCILEWSQRSKECPICWQSFVLKDPASQELLDAVERERYSRARNISSSVSTTHSFREDSDTEHDTSYPDDSDIDEWIMHHLATATSRSRYFRRRERQRSAGLGPSQVLVFASSPQRTNESSPTNEECGSPIGSSLPSGSPSEAHLWPLSPVVPPNMNLVGRTGNDSTFFTETSSDSSRRTEMFSFPQSVKSKFSATSARYKESFSRSTQGIKEKLLARNNSVKELSRGVQREMTAKIAGVARMIERLDLTSKRNASSVSDSGPSGGVSNIFKGKNVQENAIAEVSAEKREENVHKLSANASSCVSTTIPGAIKISLAQKE